MNCYAGANSGFGGFRWRRPLGGQLQRCRLSFSMCCPSSRFYAHTISALRRKQFRPTQARASPRWHNRSRTRFYISSRLDISATLKDNSLCDQPGFLQAQKSVVDLTTSSCCVREGSGKIGRESTCLLASSATGRSPGRLSLASVTERYKATEIPTGGREASRSSGATLQ